MQWVNLPVISFSMPIIVSSDCGGAISRHIRCTSIKRPCILNLRSDSPSHCNRNLQTKCIINYKQQQLFFLSFQNRYPGKQADMIASPFKWSCKVWRICIQIFKLHLPAISICHSAVKKKETKSIDSIKWIKCLPAKMFCLHHGISETEHLNRLHYVIPSIQL